MPIPANVKNEIDAFRSERPSLASWSDKEIYKTLKRKIQILYGMR